MKSTYFKIIGISFLMCLLINNKSIAQVGIGTTSPNASSMLDIDVTSLAANSKKGMLIPRMLSSERIAITSPANGLLVFDTTTASFWFYSGGWGELVNNNSLIDTDGDTGIIIEQIADEDKIRISTSGSQRMTIDKDGNTRIGNGTNNTYIEADGSLSYEGTATRWDDLKVPVTSLKEKGINIPNWDPFIGGTYTYWFKKETSASNENELFFTVQMPHAWKEGSNIFPHVHWTADANIGTSKVEWGLEYTWANPGSVFGAIGTILVDTPVAALGTVNVAFKHVISSFPEIAGSGKTLSSILMCRLFRKSRSGSNDTYSGKAALLEIDFHYEIDSDGSRDEFIK